MQSVLNTKLTVQQMNESLSQQKKKLHFRKKTKKLVCDSLQQLANENIPKWFLLCLREKLSDSPATPESREAQPGIW